MSAGSAVGAGTRGLGVESLTVRFDGDAALTDVDLHLPVGEVLAVLGPSGSGKSTLLRVVAGLQPAASGRVRWDGEDLARVPVHRRGFALMFQDGQLFSHRSVGDNVAYALPRAGRTGRDRRVAELLELVGLPGYADRRPATLSGGEQQRVALARALAAEPRLLLLDEPLSSLDAALRARLAGDLRGILEEAGATAVAVTHDHAEAFALADRVAILDRGVLQQQGAPADVWRQPASPTVATFLGYERVLDGDVADGVRAVGGGAPDPRPLAVRPGVLVLRGMRAETSSEAVAGETVPGERLPGEVMARVVGVRPGPEHTRVDVEVDGWGRLPAYAALDAGPLPRAGDDVVATVDLSRTAPVGSGCRRA